MWGWDVELRTEDGLLYNDDIDINNDLNINIGNTQDNTFQSSKSKAEFEFFKIYFRSHYAQNLSQAKNSSSDFVKIGKWKWDFFIYRFL